MREEAKKSVNSDEKSEGFENLDVPENLAAAEDLLKRSTDELEKAHNTLNTDLSTALSNLSRVNEKTSGLQEVKRLGLKIKAVLASMSGAL